MTLHMDFIRPFTAKPFLDHHLYYLTQRITTSWLVPGTNAYTPPEFFRTGKYDGCQGTVWQIGILLVETLSPVMAFDKPEQSLNMAPRLPEHLSPGKSQDKKYCPLSNCFQISHLDSKERELWQCRSGIIWFTSSVIFGQFSDFVANDFSIRWSFF